MILLTLCFCIKKINNFKFKLNNILSHTVKEYYGKCLIILFILKDLIHVKYFNTKN